MAPFHRGNLPKIRARIPSALLIRKGGRAGPESPGLAGPHPQPNQLPGWIQGSWQRPGPLGQCLRSQGGPSETLTSKAEIEPRVPGFRHVSGCDFLPEEPVLQACLGEGWWAREEVSRRQTWAREEGARQRRIFQTLQVPVEEMGAADSYRPRSEDCSRVARTIV